MTWEAIYWHVWAACQIFQFGDIAISSLETDRYKIESDGIGKLLLIYICNFHDLSHLLLIYIC